MPDPSTVASTIQRAVGVPHVTDPFPAIGAGVADFSYEEVAAEMAEVIAEDLLGRQSPIEVTIYLFDRYGEMTEMDFIRFFEEFARRVPRFANHGQQVACEERHVELPPGQALMSEDVLATNQEIKMRRVHHLRMLVNALEDQRYKLEEGLIEVISVEDDSAVGKLRQKLHENEELRLGYLNELKILSEQDRLPPQQRSPRRSITPSS